MKKLAIALLCALTVSLPVFASGGQDSAAAKPVKIGISIPSADHGWTGGIVWWANKAVKDIEASQPGKFQFRVVTADSPSSVITSYSIHYTKLYDEGMKK